jgi:hypothetical protein
MKQPTQGRAFGGDLEGLPSPEALISLSFQLDVTAGRSAGVHRQVRRRFGCQGAQGRQAAEDHRHRLLLVRQDQYKRSQDRRRSLRLFDRFGLRGIEEGCGPSFFCPRLNLIPAR